jgi:acetyl esterase/lipase
VSTAANVHRLDILSTARFKAGGGEPDALPVRRVTAAYGPSPACKLDIYSRPDSSGDPLVVFVHGGGWRFGTRADGRLLVRPILRAGFALCCIDYRSMPAVEMADIAGDVANATASVLAHAAECNLQPGRFAFLGHSAGGHLAALVATDPAYADACGLDLGALASVVTLDGVFNVERPIYNPRFEDVEAVARQNFSPIRHIRTITGRPRFLLIHSESEARFVKDAQDFSRELAAAEHAVTALRVPGISHKGLIGEFASADRPMAAAVTQCLMQSLARADVPAA